MNRPSRTEDDLVHPTWNQNPPFLAPDLTTREDLNGIANSRELKGAAGSSAAALSLLLERSQLFGRNDLESDDCLSLPVEIVPLQERLHRLLSRISHSKAWGWTWWAVSVLATATFLSSLGLNPTPTSRAASPAPSLAPASSPSPRHSIYRRDECEANNVRSAEYDVPLHVGALLIVLFVSTLACLFPLLARRFPRLRVPDTFFFAIRHFGTGVLIATAFIHLLPTAFASLGNPCLSAFWTQDYPAMPGAIALAGVFFVIVIEMVLSPARRFSPCRTGVGAGDRSRTSLDDARPTPNREVEMASLGEDQIASPGQLTPRNPDAPEVGAKKSRDAEPPGERDAELLAPGGFLTQEQKLQKEILQCVLLEIGILFHSVFIGMALSVAVGNDFVVLLIAIVFHQTFEGLALGSRIAAIDWSSHPQRPWLMCVAYGLTTPIGQAIGLATHTLYSPGSAFGLVLVGTMNAISSGLLVYASLVELVAVDFLSDESWEVLRGKKRVAACFIVFAGALCMGLVGAWA